MILSRISPEVPPLHNPSSPWPPWWPWMALAGIALPKCTWHAATSAGQKSSRVQPSATKIISFKREKWYSSSFRSENSYTVYGSSCKRKRKSPHRQAGLFPVVGPCACFGAWGHVRHLANHCLTTPTTSPDSAFKHWVLKEFSCQVSRLNPAMYVDVKVCLRIRHLCLRIRHLYDEFNTLFTEVESNLIQICVSHPQTFHIYILHSMRNAHWVHRFWNSHSPILLIAPGSEIKEHSAFPKPAA